MAFLYFLKYLLYKFIFDIHFFQLKFISKLYYTSFIFLKVKLIFCVLFRNMKWNLIGAEFLLLFSLSIKSCNRKIISLFCLQRWLHFQISVTYTKYALSFAKFTALSCMISRSLPLFQLIILDISFKIDNQKVNI